MGNFTKDLSFGKTWETIAMSLVGGGSPGPSGRFKPYDFTHNGIKYEVKADRLAYKYGGNTMFVEYECSCQPSGIATTEADVWMYFMVKPDGSYKCYSVPVADLREWCKGCRTKAGGDGYRALGYIVPVRTPPLVTAEQAGVQSQAELPRLAVADQYIHLPPPSPLAPRAQKTTGSRTPPSPLQWEVPHE